MDKAYIIVLIRPYYEGIEREIHSIWLNKDNAEKTLEIIRKNNIFQYELETYIISETIYVPGYTPPQKTI